MKYLSSVHFAAQHFASGHLHGVVSRIRGRVSVVVTSTSTHTITQADTTRVSVSSPVIVSRQVLQDTQATSIGSIYTNDISTSSADASPGSMSIDELSLRTIKQDDTTRTSISISQSNTATFKNTSQAISGVSDDLQDVPAIISSE